MSIGTFENLAIAGVTTFYGSLDLTYANITGLPSQIGREDIVELIQAEGVSLQKAIQIAKMEAQEAVMNIPEGLEEQDIIKFAKSVSVDGEQAAVIAKYEAEKLYETLPAGPKGFGIHATCRTSAKGEAIYSHGIDGISINDDGYVYHLSEPILDARYSVNAQLVESLPEAILTIVDICDAEFTVKITNGTEKLPTSHCITVFAG